MNASSNAFATPPPQVTAGIAWAPPRRAYALATRHKAYCEGQLMACSLGSTEPHDQWDKDPKTTLYLVEVDGKPVASARIIEATSEFGLQATDKFVAKDQLRGDWELSSIIECSRVALDPDFSRDVPELRSEVLQALLGVMARHRLGLNQHHWVQTVRWNMALILLGLGIPIELVPQRIEIEDTSVEGVPMTGESLFLGYINLCEVALVTFYQRPDVYERIFGTTELIVAPDDIMLAKLKERIRKSRRILKANRPVRLH